MACIAGPCPQSPITCSHNRGILKERGHRKGQAQAQRLLWCGPSASTRVLRGTREGRLGQWHRSRHLGRIQALPVKFLLAGRQVQLGGIVRNRRPRLLRQPAQTVAET